MATHDPEQRSKLGVGRIVAGRWRIERLLGTGGMAAVYEAVHRNGRRVAIKLLHPHLAADDRIVRRFFAEASLANGIHHPAVVGFYDEGLDEDRSAFLVMELLRGESLEALRLRCGGRLESRLVQRFGRELLAALHVAHGSGVIHRDIKPANLWVQSDGTLRILDFGIAKCLDESRGGGGATGGLLLGTPAFMAPEHARGLSARIDARTDVWAVGATMFTLLTGRLVHHGETVNEQLAMAVAESAPRLAEYYPEVPAGLARIIDRALEYEMDRRWQSAGEMLDALEGEIQGLAATSDATSDASSSVVLTVPCSGSQPRQDSAGALRRHAPLGAALALALAVTSAWLLSTRFACPKLQSSTGTVAADVASRVSRLQSSTRGAPVTASTLAARPANMEGSALVPSAAPPAPIRKVRLKVAQHVTPAIETSSSHRVLDARAARTNPLDWRE